MTLKQALWEIVRDENIVITNQNIDWLLDRALKKASGDAQALKESILERKGVIEENIPATLTNEEKVSEKLLINENKSNNFDVKSNNELFKQALVEGVNNRFNKILDEEEKTEEMATVIRQITTKCCNCEYYEEDGSCNKPAFVDCNENEDILIVCDALYEHNYRKQSEGENISKMHPSDEFICEKCGLIIRECCRYEIDEDDGDEICYEFPYRFCPRCGMKVKGGEQDA